MMIFKVSNLVVCRSDLTERSLVDKRETGLREANKHVT